MKKNYLCDCNFMQTDDDNDDVRVTQLIKKTCTLEFESGKCKLSVDLNEDEMKQLVGSRVMAFAINAADNATSEADDE